MVYPKECFSPFFPAFDSPPYRLSLQSVFYPPSMLRDVVNPELTPGFVTVASSNEERYQVKPTLVRGNPA